MKHIIIWLIKKLDLLYKHYYATNSNGYTLPKMDYLWWVGDSLWFNKIAEKHWIIVLKKIYDEINSFYLLEIINLINSCDTQWFVKLHFLKVVLDELQETIKNNLTSNI